VCRRSHTLPRTVGANPEDDITVRHADDSERSPTRCSTRPVALAGSHPKRMRRPPIAPVAGRARWASRFRARPVTVKLLASSRHPPTVCTAVAESPHPSRGSSWLDGITEAGYSRRGGRATSRVWGGVLYCRYPPALSKPNSRDDVWLEGREAGGLLAVLGIRAGWRDRRMRRFAPELACGRRATCRLAPRVTRGRNRECFRRNPSVCRCSRAGAPAGYDFDLQVFRGQDVEPERLATAPPHPHHHHRSPLLPSAPHHIRTVTAIFATPPKYRVPLT
jgi:hypothetical protein